MNTTAYTPRPGVAGQNVSFVFDQSQLDQLKRNVSGKEDKDSEMEVARQFEALFIQQMLNASRRSSMSNDLFVSDQTKMVQGMNDEQMALNLASATGIGLSSAIFDLMQASKASASNHDARLTKPQASGSVDDMATGAPRIVAESITALLGQLSTSMTGALGTVKRTLAGVEPIKNASERVSQFVARLSDAACAAAKKTGVPAVLLMSQAALESGWGQREIKHPNGETSHNLFGIKATGNWAGKIVHIMTTEYVDGTPRKMSQPFRAYDSYEESIADYARLISENPRYGKVMTAENAAQAAYAVQNAGYATDPRYAEKLIQIMSKFKAA